MSDEASSRKRKAEEISDDDANDADEGIPHLPAPVWGHVLDYMPYEEVRSALLVGKHIAVEAVKYVQTLNIMKSSQMFIPAARRFANAEEVNILCLLVGTGEIDDDSEEELYTISLDAANRTVPFLASVPKIKRGFVGGEIMSLHFGMRHRYNHAYETDACHGPSDHGDIFRSLMSSYIGAVKTGALPPGLILEGIIDALQDIRLCREKSVSCQWCRDILLHFPLRQLFPFLISTFYDVDENDERICLTQEEAWSVVSRRSDISKGLKENSDKILTDYVFSESDLRTIANKHKAAAVEELPEKWRGEERTCTFFRLRYMHESAFEALGFLIEKGFDPKLIQREPFLKRFRRTFGIQNYGNNFIEFHVWSRTTVEKLAARGFPTSIDCESFPVLSHKTIERINEMEDWDDVG